MSKTTARIEALKRLVSELTNPADNERNVKVAVLIQDAEDFNLHSANIPKEHLPQSLRSVADELEGHFSRIEEHRQLSN